MVGMGRVELPHAVYQTAMLPLALHPHTLVGAGRIELPPPPYKSGTHTSIATPPCFRYLPILSVFTELFSFHRTMRDAGVEPTTI
jgi:hypothetical protein